MDATTIPWVKHDAQHKANCDSRPEFKEWEYATVGQLECLRRQKSVQGVDPGMHGNTNEQYGRKVHFVDSTLQELTIPSFGPTIAIRQHGLKPVLATDCIADADQAIKSNLVSFVAENIWMPHYVQYPFAHDVDFNFILTQCKHMK